MFTLKIETDNASFQDQPVAEAVADVLDRVARELRRGPSRNVAGGVWDQDGNTVGEYRLS
jgi:hypothetical protein